MSVEICDIFVLVAKTLFVFSGFWILIAEKLIDLESYESEIIG